MTSPDERPQLAVEVKNTRQTSASWAAQLRRNLLAYSAVPNTPFFMVIAFDRLFLWRQSSLALSDQAPDYEVDAHQFLQPYYDKGGFDGRAPSSDAMEILVTGWLSDLIRADLPRTEKKFAWLFDSGLYDAIRHGIVRTEASV